jgi:hypothetical protein
MTNTASLSLASRVNLTNLRSGTTCVLIKRTETTLQSPNFAYDVLVDGQRLVPLAGNGWKGEFHLPNILGDIGTSLSCDVIDLGTGGKGIGFSITSFLAALAREQGLPLRCLATCQFGVIRLLEGVSDFRFQAISVKALKVRAERDYEVGLGYSGRARVYVSANSITTPHIAFNTANQQYWLDLASEDAVGSILFESDAAGGLFFSKGAPSADKSFDFSDSGSGASIRHFEFLPNGIILYKGGKIGYAVSLGFQLENLTGFNPQPSSNVTIEIAE